MNNNYFKKISIVAMLATASIATNASAADTPAPVVDNFHTIYGSNFVAGSSTYTTTFLGYVDATFQAKTTTNKGAIVDGRFSKKDDQSPYAYGGVGVSPTSGSERTPGEIDIGEYIDAKFTIVGPTHQAAGIPIESFTLGLLFDGPEYKDVHEVAQVTATLFGGGSLTYTFTATGTQAGIWTGQGSFASLSPAVEGRGGIWKFSNPFGNALVSGISFTALPGVAAASCHSCNNQSDFTLISVSAVPEPESYAMLLAGLAAITLVVRKKKQG